MNKYYVTCEYIIPIAAAADEGHAREQAVEILNRISEQSLKMWLISHSKVARESFVGGGDFANPADM